jgi:hypothetical protein
MTTTSFQSVSLPKDKIIFGHESNQRERKALSTSPEHTWSIGNMGKIMVSFHSKDGLSSVLHDFIPLFNERTQILDTRSKRPRD